MTSTHSQFATDEEESDIDYEEAQRGVRLLLEAVGEDPDRDVLTETWQCRVPDAFAALTEGRRETAKPTMRSFDAETAGLAVKTGIPAYSLCERHLLPFFGTIHLACRPTDQVGGLSKLTRFVRWQSRQLTMQEQLANDIASGLKEELDAATDLVEMNATHLCGAMRGVETESTTTSRATVGEPTEAERERFQAAVNRTEGQR